MIVEHAIGRIKRYEIMTVPYDGTIKDFRDEFWITAGLANFNLLWDEKRKRPGMEF